MSGPAHLQKLRLAKGSLKFLLLPPPPSTSSGGEAQSCAFAAVINGAKGGKNGGALPLPILVGEGSKTWGCPC
jgi:hypothetical protein